VPGPLFCQAASPDDGVKNDSETDIDCGGALLAGGLTNPASDGAPPCAHGKACALGADCASGVCNTNGDSGGPPIDCPAGAMACVCQLPSPTDGVKNGGETDVDCGGGTTPGSDGAPPCAPMMHCKASTDCASLVCATNGLCAAPSPYDGIKNDSETDVDCGGKGSPTSDGAPACADDKGCAADSDCLSGFCSMLSNTCVAGQSCKGLVTAAQIMDQTGTVNPDMTVTVAVNANGDAIGVPDPNGAGQNAGLDTCGVGESTDPPAMQKHESCCRSLLNPAGTLRIDKYEVTAGRVRQFLESLNWDVRDWALAQFDAMGNPLTPAGTNLAAGLPVNQAGSTNALTLLPHSNDPTEPLNAVVLTGALVLDTSGVQGCYTNDGAGGAATYWWDAETIHALASSPPRPFTQDYYDIKPMNCIPYYLAAAFCAWDGGRLPTEPEHAAIWGASTYPWGSASPPVLYNGSGGAAFLAAAAAAGLPITGYTVDWADGNQAAGAQGNFYFYPSWVTNVPNEFVPSTLSNTLDLSPYIAAPGRFYADETAARSSNGEGWHDLGADMIELGLATPVTGPETFCDESGVLGPGQSYNCGSNGVVRGTGLPGTSLLGGSWEGHGVVETLIGNGGWSFYRQYGKAGLRCVRAVEPSP
jgi:hypothetical protein